MLTPSSRNAPAAVVALLMVLQAACTEPSSETVGTAEQRAALFDYIIERTGDREAFSAIKNERLGIDPLEEMRQQREDFVAAETEEELYYALVRLSNARRDRHLDVALVPGGLELPDSAGLSIVGTEADTLVPHAPLKVQIDFGNTDGTELFVSDVATGWEDQLQIGDRVLAINGESVGRHRERLEPYIRYSSIPNMLWRFAEMVPQRTAEVPPSYYGNGLRVEFQRGDERFTMSLPYLDPDSLVWTNVGEPAYDGFELVFETQTYHLYASEADLPVIVLQWHGFREDLVQDVDRLAEWASETGHLDNAVIVDATRSRGGSKGAYAVQHLVSRPFTVPFGNLKMSDVIPPFIDDKLDEYRRGQVDDSGVSETVDDGAWLIDWLQTDVQAAYDAGQEYSNDVPFKLAHAPRQSDGVLPPADPHFTGPLVVFSGPRRGSHLDQFVATVVDNDLGVVLGMPAGGYSNTWEWEETLRLPGTDQAVAQFMWSIGHTVRANGEVLEGNPAEVDEYIPLTRENFRAYYDILMQRALTHLGLGT